MALQHKEDGISRKIKKKYIEKLKEHDKKKNVHTQQHSHGLNKLRNNT
jgi:replication initiation and membrane attachment protein DnaB